MTEDPYLTFLRGKIDIAPTCGFSVELDEIHPLLKPHQRDIVRWAVAGGRRALFEAFGLGKSLQQIETLRLVKSRAGGRVLIVCPLGVRQEFRHDGAMVGVEFKFIRTADEMAPEDSGFYLTNYESIRDGRLDPNLFTAVSLDEASVLRSFGSLTYQRFLTLFKDVPFRFVATATPSPNRYKELIHYAGFLGIMDTGQALTRFFQRDSTQANNLTLYPHMERAFWLWLHSWAIFLQKPSDLGYSDEGYDLPELNVIWHEIPVDHSQVEADRDGQVPLFQESALGLKQAAEAKRQSLEDRVAKMREILDDDPDSHYLLWHDLEAERHAIKKAVPEASEVCGSLDLDTREQRVIDFSEGRLKYLASKPEISGSGCNFQRHCHKAIFLGVGYKFNDFIQSIHRIYRFLQEFPCEIHILYSEAEREIKRVLVEKWTQHNRMVGNMSDIIQAQGLAEMDLDQILARTLGVERIEVTGRGYAVANNDCVLEARRQPENHAGLIVTSIPFSNHYEYTPSFNDFGHTRNNEHFWEQMDFLTPELLRILKPGRIYACHVKDRILFGNVTGAGAPTVSPFHAEALFHGMKHGFDYLGMITVVTDVVRENNQTYRLGWSENAKDGTKMGVGSPEYILLFRKPQTDRTKGYADDPVKKPKTDYTRAQWQIDAHAFWRSSGDRFLTSTELEGYGAGEMVKLFTEMSLHRIYDYQQHVKIGEHLEKIGSLPATFMSIAPGSHCEAVWHDVNRMRTLNGEQTQKGLANHVCLAKGSLVLTSWGYKPIESVQVGDLVLTHMGRWRPVLASQRTGVRPVVTVRSQGVPGLTLTPAHKLWARRVQTNAWSTAHSRLAAKDVEPGWLEASESRGSYVNQKLTPTHSLDISDQELWLIGRWIADGHVETRGNFMVSIGKAKVDEFRRMAGSHVGGEREGTALQVRLINFSKVAAVTLARCGSSAGAKQFPRMLLDLPEPQARVLLLGYLSGDGHHLKSRDRWMCTTVSKCLALGTSMLAQRAYGAIASVYAGRQAGHTTIEGRTVRTRQEWIVSFDIPNAKRKNHLPFLLEDGAWKKVRTVEDAGEAETFNLRVEEDESYTAEGCIVKNCPLQFDIVDRLIVRYSNPGDLVYDPFGGLMTVPVRALKLGRRGQASELNHAYFLDGANYLKAAEADLATPTLFNVEAFSAEAAS